MPIYLGRAILFSPADMQPVDRIPDLQAAVSGAHATGNRRQSPRVRHQCHAEVSLWIDGRAGSSFAVALIDLATEGVGIRHTDRLSVGSRYLLEIARAGGKPLATVVTVVRCDETVGGWFEVALAPDDILTLVLPSRLSKPKPSRRIKLGLIALAFIVSAVGMFIALR
jgi:hypothetical protein